MPHEDTSPVLPSSSEQPAGGAPALGDVDHLLGLLGAQQHVGAEALARKLIAGFPAHDLAWKALGASLKAQGRLAEAVVAQQQAALLAPDDAAIHYNVGNSLLASGRHAAAAQSYRRALALEPASAEANTHLGHALAAQGQLAEAVQAYRCALQIRADAIDAHAGLAHALLVSGAPADAEAHFLRVLAARPHDAKAHNSLGVVYRGLGRLADAEDCYRAALAITPQAAELHNNLGNTLREQGRIELAQASYRHAAALDGTLAEPLFNLGNTLRAQALQVEAEDCYRRALAIDPGYLMALNNLGLCLKKQGRLEEASACFESAIAIKPDFLQSQCNLAPFRHYTADDPHLHVVEQQQHQLPALPVAGRISYWFALGKMREDAGRYADAFAAYAEGNRLQRQELPYDEAAEVGLMQRLRGVFSAEFIAAGPAPDPSARVPVFIVGMPRSGTTLIEQILSSCAGVHGAGELTDLDDMLHVVGHRAGDTGIAYPEAVVGLAPAALRRLGEAYIERVWQLAPDAERITDKLPANFLHVGMIRRMLPQAKIIHAMRDPMDSCFSCYARLFEGGNLPFSYDLGSVGRYYVRYIQLMQHWQEVLPRASMLELRYEDMVADTEGQARRLLDYLGLPWDERCLDFHRNQRVVRTASIAQVRKPIYHSSVARWKHFDTQLMSLQKIVAPYR
jgi:tetratricopeptide (TPR) repeat protein